MGGGSGYNITYTKLSASAAPAPLGQPVTFTARVSTSGSAPQGGTVSFYDGITLLATANLSNGTASFQIATLSRGSHSITAVYSGDAGDQGSMSQTLNEMIM